MSIRFLHVATPDKGTPLREPLVIAVAGEHLVKYSRRDGWTCDCDTAGEDCPHVDAVDELLDDRVLGDAR